MSLSDMGGNNISTPRQSPKRKRPYGSSDLWDHFTKIRKPDVEKVDQATCNYCEIELDCGGAKGIITLEQHLDECEVYKNNDLEHELLSLSSEAGDSSFDQELCWRNLVSMITMEGLPLGVIDHICFKNFSASLNPDFKLMSCKTLIQDIVKTYMSEKKKLKELFVNSSQRFSLSADIWTSAQDFSYMRLTAHCINEEWELQQKIISFRLFIDPDGEIIGQAIEECLSLWGIDNLWTITMDDASSSDVAVRTLTRMFNKNRLLLDGQLFHMKCFTCFLNHIVKDMIEEAHGSLDHIRNSIVHVWSSKSRLKKFNGCANEEGIVTCNKSLCWDDSTQWNSTFLMLASALEFQRALERYVENYLNPEVEVDAIPTRDDWCKARNLFNFLEIFYLITKKLSWPKHVTSSMYFPKVFGIKNCLRNWASCHENMCFRDMAKKIEEKFDRCLGSLEQNNLMLLIAVVLDPRYKLKFVEFCYSIIYPKEKVDEIVEKVKRTMGLLFQQYQASGQVHTSIEDSSADGEETREEDSMMRKFRRMLQETNAIKSELERYLDESVEEADSGFDILYWWKINISRYRVLSRMARDVLAIPVSAMTSEHAFSTEGQALEKSHDLLPPKLTEVLICARDWGGGSFKPVMDEKELLEEFKLDFGN